jgi:hypothetical protein
MYIRNVLQGSNFNHILRPNVWYVRSSDAVGLYSSMRKSVAYMTNGDAQHWINSPSNRIKGNYSQWEM